jgi:hypothetical protein
MTKLAYDYTHMELVDAFVRAVAKAGVANSGLVIEIMGPHHAREARYLRGVLLARLEGQERPFTKGDRVRLKTRLAVSSVNYDGGYYRREVHAGKEYAVSRVFYDGIGKWSISLGEDADFRFPAEEFKKTPQEVPQPA